MKLLAIIPFLAAGLALLPTLLTILKFAVLVWLGVLVTATVVLAALYMFDFAALAIRRVRSR